MGIQYIYIEVIEYGKLWFVFVCVKNCNYDLRNDCELFQCVLNISYNLICMEGGNWYFVMFDVFKIVG